MKKNIFRTKRHIFGILILTFALVSVAVSQAVGGLQLENLNFFSKKAESGKVEKTQFNKPEYKQQSNFTSGANEKSPSAATPQTAQGASSHVSIVDLIAESELIVQGTIISVTDGIENKIPFTEVKMKVGETLQGEAGEEVTFRQFGLMKPRLMPDGYVNLNVTPEGWATYKADEQVMIFLYKTASLTGLRAPVGLSQGKFSMQSASIINQTGNIGLFQDVEVDKKLLNDRDNRLLATKKGPVNADAFASFVRRAVKDKWIEGGKLKNAKK